MADRRGRCTNTAYCDGAVMQKIVVTPAGWAFECPKCGDPLQDIKAAMASPRARAVMLVQVLMLVVAGGGILFEFVSYVRAGPRTAAPADMHDGYGGTKVAVAQPVAVAPAGSMAAAAAKRVETVPVTASDRFAQLVRGARRIPIDFHFQQGSTALDRRGALALRQLVSFLRAEHADGSRLILAGFADNHGSPAESSAMAQKRTDTVVAALARVAIKPAIVANFGADLPVGDNATAEGRDRNRRIEVYLKVQ